MTDKEVVQVLENMLKNFDGTVTDFMAISSAIDLINRQKAKIEALQMDNKQLETDNFNANMNCENLQAEIERLEKHTEMYHELRAEAIKEFAARLRYVSKWSQSDAFSDRLVTVRDINDLEKEMVGED